jgi:acyl-CoA synthetase (AMP-forming)/AMP-acid ligase II
VTADRFLPKSIREHVTQAVGGLSPLLELANPQTVKRMREAGTMGPKSTVAVAAALPWLLGRGPSLGITSQMNALVVGGKTAVVDRGGSLTWRELDRRANRVGRALRNNGLKGGDRVGMLLRNTREFTEVALGSQKLGLIACPMNTWAKPKELTATLDGAEPAILFYDSQHAEQVQAAAPKVPLLVVVGDPAEGVEGSIAYEDLLDGCADAPVVPFTRDRGSPKVIIQTSGTTGTPKGASRDAAASGMGAMANLLGVVPYRREDIVFCPAPLFHSFGMATFTFATVLGATMVLPEKFEPEESLALIQEHRATAASFVPVMIKRIVDLPDMVKSKYDLSSMRIVLASGSAMSTGLRRAAVDVFGPVVYDLYGSTEIGWVAIATPEDMESRPSSVGRPVPGIEVAVFTDEGERLPPGRNGELYVRSDLLFEGYTSGEAKKEHDGYMSIGDLGRLDEDGYLFVEGRADDMVVVGGENVYPVEIEAVIESIKGVKEAAVLGVTDDEYGEVLAAFVSGSAGPDKVVEVCKKELASYKVPKRVEIRDELPRTSTGKVLKRELIEQLSGAEPLDT